MFTQYCYQVRLIGVGLFPAPAGGEIIHLMVSDRGRLSTTSARLRVWRKVCGMLGCLLLEQSSSY